MHYFVNPVTNLQSPFSRVARETCLLCWSIEQVRGGFPSLVNRYKPLSEPHTAHMAQARMPNSKQQRESESADGGHYEPLLAPSERQPSLHLPPGAAVQQGGSAVTCEQPSIQASFLDIPHVAAGLPVDSSVTGQGGTLVFLPDLPNTVQLWHGQRPIMIIWMVSSLAAMALFTPLFMSSGLFLAPEIAAVLGIVASSVQLCERGLAASSILELGAQMKLVASCSSAACFLDGLTLLLDLVMLWSVRCDAEDDICVAITKYALLCALSCIHHGIVSWMVSSRTNSLMVLLNPVSSGAVQL